MNAGWVGEDIEGDGGTAGRSDRAAKALSIAKEQGNQDEITEIEVSLKILEEENGQQPASLVRESRGSRDGEP